MLSLCVKAFKQGDVLFQLAAVGSLVRSDTGCTCPRIADFLSPGQKCWK